MSEPIFLGRMKERMTGLACPQCGSPAEGATCVNDGPVPLKVKPGDYSMCAQCGAMLLYIDNPASRCGLGLRLLRAEEWAAMRRDPRLKKLTDAAAFGKGLKK